MAVFFLFVDGIGLGDPGSHNPFNHNSYTAIESLCGGPLTNELSYTRSQNHVCIPVDANLDVEGLPQSGTGQASLFTGTNASKKIGKHFGPFPHSGIRPLLKEKSIFHDVLHAGLKPYFMNAYPPVFFERAEKRNRWSCTTLMAKSAGLSLQSTEDVLNERALTAEIIQKAWREKLNIPLPSITPKQAGSRILKMMNEYDFVLYEYYLTDKAGHSQKQEDARRVLQPLNEFLQEIMLHMKTSDTMVICSDHGNLEDLSTKTHTRNKVPLIVWGSGADKLQTIGSIMQVKDGILRLLAG